MLKRSILPRMRFETRGCVTPRTRAALGLAQALTLDVIFERHHQRRSQLHGLGRARSVFDRVPSTGESFLGHLRSLQATARKRLGNIQARA